VIQLDSRLVISFGLVTQVELGVVEDPLGAEDECLSRAAPHEEAPLRVFGPFAIY